MNIQFENINNRYEAEFAVTDAFNLNLIRESRGILTIYQKGAVDGDYPLKPSYHDQKAPAIIDVDITTAVYPKYIKVISTSPVLQGVVTTDGELITNSNTGGSMEIIVEPYTEPITYNADFDFGTFNIEGDEEGVYSLSVSNPYLIGSITIPNQKIIVLYSKIQYSADLITESTIDVSYDRGSTIITIRATTYDSGGSSPVLSLKLAKIS